MNIRNKIFFSLIELIVVVVVIGILAVIVIPNISDIKDKSLKTSVLNNAKSIQTAVDMYSLNNDGKLPSIEQPTRDIPAVINFGSDYSKYIKNLPNDNTYYWIDHTGKVWFSTVDAPSEVRLNYSYLEWLTVEKAKFYRIYKVNGTLNSTAKTGLTLIDEVENDRIGFYRYEDVEKGASYLISSVDYLGLESVPVGFGYMGYPYNNWNEAVNQENPPVAVINKNKNVISQGESILWGYEDSYHPEGLDIVEAQWGGYYQNAYDNSGVFTVFLRVKDEKGTWSSIVSDTVFVTDSEDISFGEVEGYVEIPHIKEYHPNTNQISLEMWINPNNWGVRDSGCSSLFSKRITNTTGMFVYAECTNDTIVVDLGGVKERWDTEYYAPLNTWTYIVYTYDGEMARFYVNGELFNETDEHGDMSKLDNADIRIGKDFSYGKDDYYFDGSIKGLRLWNVALSEQEIKENMVGFNNYKDNRLLGAWSIYENAENKVYDMSNHQNHGVFIYD